MQIYFAESQKKSRELSYFDAYDVDAKVLPGEFNEELTLKVRLPMDTLFSRCVNLLFHKIQTL